MRKSTLSNSGQMKSSLLKQIKLHKNRLKGAGKEEKQRIKTNLSLLQEEYKKLKNRLG